MSRTEDRRLRHMKLSQEEVQAKIILTFGVEHIAKQKKLLCDTCNALHCTLLPVTRDGGDCPYWNAERHPFG